MPDLKKLTLKYLRDLARKHLGAGHSKLKTKAELLKALKRWLPSMPAARPQAAATAPATPAAASSKRVPAPRHKVAVAAHAARPSPVEAEPLVEGFFVAKVAGEGEARRHHLTEERSIPAPEAPPAGYDEGLGELPQSYDDDTAVLLPRDPHTAFVFWDFSAQTRAAAALGLQDPKAVLRVYDGDHCLREIDFALESRSFYVHGLAPGRHYRMEAGFKGRDGAWRRLGTTGAVELPRLGPSSDLSLRFLRLPWGLRISRLREHLREGRARLGQRREEAQVELWRRVPLPGSGGLREDWEALGMSGREGGASEALARHE